MSVRHWEIEVAGESVAQVISLGERYVLYSTHPAVRILDGQIFATLDAARDAAHAALGRKTARHRSAA